MAVKWGRSEMDYGDVLWQVPGFGSMPILLFRSFDGLLVGEGENRCVLPAVRSCCLVADWSSSVPISTFHRSRIAGRDWTALENGGAKIAEARKKQHFTFTAQRVRVAGHKSCCSARSPRQPQLCGKAHSLLLRVGLVRYARRQTKGCAEVRTARPALSRWRIGY